jgi:protein TonB
MQTSKLDLYNPEWLELVFAKRNKAYGAYELRQTYNATMNKAMGFTILGLAVIVGFGFVLHKPVKPEKYVKIVTFNIVKPPVIEHPKVEPPKPRSLQPAQPVKTIKFVPPVVTSAPVTVDPPKVDDLSKAAIGPADVKVPGKGDVIAPILDNPGTGTTPAPPSTEVFDAGSIEVMPEPYGGAAAWSKFLQKNMHYPSQAVEQEKQGKVWVSFIIERDGHLSNIEVVKGPGFGMDEEALRVLKLAPAWKPGVQNKQAVRVRYTIPINFQLNEQ